MQRHHVGLFCDAAAAQSLAQPEHGAVIDAKYTEELELIATLAKEFGKSATGDIVDGLLFGISAALSDEYFPPKKGKKVPAAEQAPNRHRRGFSAIAMAPVLR